MRQILIGAPEAHTGSYIHALSALGARPMTISGTGSGPKQTDPCHFDGLLLPGGGDIHPALFGQQNQGSAQINPALDLLQLRLFWAFFLAGKPVLGICKGMQIINVALGGTLLQDLPEPICGIHAWQDQDQRHCSRILKGTWLEQLYGEQLTVNSAHHQAVSVTGRGLLPAQYGPGSVLEALYHESRPILGVQWHPERMLRTAENPGTKDGSRVLLYFLRLCKEIT